MRTLNKILALIFLLSSSFVFAKDINDIEFGEFLTEEHLIELEPLHRGLSDYYDFKKNGLSGIFPDVYYWYHSDLGYEVKKIIHVIKGSNQVIVHKIEIEDPECIKFLRLFKNYYQTEKDIKMEDFDSIIGASWLEWSKKATFRITKNENLGIDFFSTNPKIDLERSKKVYCQDDILTLSEFGYEAEDEKNDWVQYTEHIKDFPMPNPFGHELYEKLKTSIIKNKIDVGLVEAKVKKPSQYFQKYFIEYIPDSKRVITKISGEYIGEDYKKIFLEVKRLLEKKYNKYLFTATSSNNELTYIGYNTKWSIRLLVDFDVENRISIDYGIRDWTILYLRKNKIDEIKSDSL